MMEILPLEATEPFSTNVLNTELVRTGTSGEGSCFFYSLYMPFKEFRSLSAQDKEEYIRKKREELAAKINYDEWFLIQNGNLAYLQIIETMRMMIHSIPSILCENQQYLEKYNVDEMAIEILFMLLNPSVVEREILPQWDMECSRNVATMTSGTSGDSENDKDAFLEQIKSTWYDIYKTKVKRSIDDLEKRVDPHIQKMTVDKKSKVVQKLSMLSYPIFDFVTSKALSDFKSEISDVHKWLNVFIFSSVMHRIDLKINVIILDADTGMPLEGMKLMYNRKKFDNDYPFVVLLYFKEQHFESLGKKTTVNKKTVINRLFKKDDPFIITCLTYLDSSLDELDHTEAQSPLEAEAQPETEPEANDREKDTEPQSELVQAEETPMLDFDMGDESINRF
jgi:hypothetical protein